LKLEVQERETQSLVNKYKRQLIRTEQHMKDLHRKAFEDMIPDMAKRLRVKESQLKEEMDKYIGEVNGRREEERRLLRLKAKRIQEETAESKDRSSADASQLVTNTNDFWEKFTQPLVATPSTESGTKVQASVR